MNFSAYSIRHPLVSIMLFLLLTIGGFIGFDRMKVQQFPDMDLPTIVVTVVMQGAPPEQLETQIARPLENRISTVANLKHSITVIRNGVVTIVNQFTLNTKVQQALDDVRSAVSEVQNELPANAQTPIVSKINTADIPAVIYTIKSSHRNIAELSWFFDNTVKKRLTALEGVGSITRVGGETRQIHIDVDPYALEVAGISFAQLSAQLQQMQQDVGGGEFQLGDYKRPIRALGSVNHASDLVNYYLNVGPHKRIRLGDIAHITDAAADPHVMALLDGKPVVAFEVSRAQGASEVEMAQRVQQELQKIQHQYPDIQFHDVYNLAKPVHELYEHSMEMLIDGAILAVIVVFLFLRNWRATLIAATALPLSIIPAFAGMYLLGYSLNAISLLALSLVVGILVDDAIVEIENIMRHLRMGKTPYEAAMEAADEIGLAVIATTFTLIAVFLPTAFMGGVVGQFFKQFGWTASIAIFGSLLVARLLTPMMAAYLLRPEPHHQEKESRIMPWYLKLVTWTIANRWKTFGITTLFFIASLSLTAFIPKTFLPEDDFSQTRVAIELPPGSTLQDTLRVSEQARRLISHNPYVKMVYSSIGKGHGGLEGDDGGSVRNAALNVRLIAREKRPLKEKIEATLRQQLQQIPGALFQVGLSNGGKRGYALTLVGDNQSLLKQTATTLMHQIHQIPGVISVRSNEGTPTEELEIIPNNIAMAQHGITTAHLAHALKVATVGDYNALLPKLNLGDRQIPMVVRLAPQYRGNLNVLNNLIVMGSTGPVRLADIAQIRYGIAPSGINRFDRSREITITTEAADNDLGSLVRAVNNTPIMRNLPQGISTVTQGQADGMRDLFKGFLTAMGIGILCILCTLILLFHRVLQPFTILMALPLSVGGAFVGLLVTHASLSMPSLIGLVMLMGIATKNSILLVDYAILAEKQGKPRLEALLDACRKRARPIIMTTVAMGAGMLPMMISLTGKSDTTFSSPMAVAIFGGLMTSTVLSLVIIPTFYTFMDDVPKLGQWVSRRYHQLRRHQPTA